MGLFDAVDEAESEHYKLDQDDVQELKERINQLEQRFKRLHRVVVNIDGRMDSMDDDMKIIKRRMTLIESSVESEDSSKSLWDDIDTDDSSDEDEDNDEDELPWQ